MCSRASLVLCPTGSCGSHASRVFHTLVPDMSRAFEPHMPYALHALVSHVPSALHSFVPCLPQTIGALVLLIPHLTLGMWGVLLPTGGNTGI